MRPWQRWDAELVLQHGVGTFFINQDRPGWWDVTLVRIDQPGLYQMGMFPSVSQAQHAVGLMLDLIEKAADANRN